MCKELNSFFVWCFQFYKCLLQRVRFYSVVFDFNKIYNKWVSLIYFLKLNQRTTFFLINVPIRRLYWPEVCTGLTFVLVWRLYWSDVFTGLTFVLAWRLYWSEVCTGLTLVLVWRFQPPFPMIWHAHGVEIGECDACPNCQGLLIKKDF